MEQETVAQSSDVPLEEVIPSAETQLDAKKHPLAHALGVFKDDPMFDLVMEEVYKNRRQMEAEEAARDEEALAA